MRDLAPELALGIAEGQKRDAALRHLSGCSECRQLVSDLSSVGDEMLLLAPAREPPADSSPVSLPGSPSRQTTGDFSRFHVAGGGSQRQPPRLWSSRPRSAEGGVLATAGDRRLADGDQAVLSQGQGAFFLAAPLEGS